jgi:hypothetical protein
MADPEQFRSSFESLEPKGDELAIRLNPYGVARIDWEE